MRVPLPSEQCFFTCAGLCLFGLHTPLPHQAYATTKIARTYAYRKPTQSYAYITVARQKPIQILVHKIPTQSLRKPGQNQCQAKRSSSVVQLFSANYYFNFQASIWLQKMLQMIDLQNPHTLELNLILWMFLRHWRNIHCPRHLEKMAMSRRRTTAPWKKVPRLGLRGRGGLDSCKALHRSTDSEDFLWDSRIPCVLLIPFQDNSEDPFLKR